MAKPISKKPIYNLNLVLQETGIKADTLRAWERRYNLPQPERTEGGHRLFSEYDIETIKWLLDRQEEGMRISRAVDLWNNLISGGEDPLFSLMSDQTIKPATEISEHESEALSYERNRWIQAVLNFNESAAEQVLTQSFAQFSLEAVCIHILQAGVAEIGSLWYQGKASVQQEHFASELVIRRLHALIAAAPQPVRSGTVLVSCPPDEHHTFSPLLITLLLRYRSWNVIYLGANVPNTQIRETIQKTSPDLVVMTSMRLATAATMLDAAFFIRELDVPVAFGGRIFSVLPKLSEKIPGYFLGGKLLEAVSAIEDLLMNPKPPLEFQPHREDYADTIADFRQHRDLIEKQALQSLAQKYDHQFSLGFLKDANEYLAQDILAALALGDIYLLGTNITWAENLLSHREFPEALILEYLQDYRNAAQMYLSESGHPILDWLETILQNGTKEQSQPSIE